MRVCEYRTSRRAIAYLAMISVEESSKAIIDACDLESDMPRHAKINGKPPESQYNCYQNGVDFAVQRHTVLDIA
eukprot:1778704-Rhodomonas_salina.6